MGKSFLLKVVLNEYFGIGIYMDICCFYFVGSGSISLVMFVDEIIRIFFGKGRVGFFRGIKVEEINFLGFYLKFRELIWVDVLDRLE